MQHSIIASRKVKNTDFNFELVNISPALAEQWLETNTNNRKVKKSYVDRMARDMAAGKWRITGDAIRFSTDGRLIDGQHRLLSCVKSGKPFYSIVVYGLPGEAQDLIDSGVPRSTADMLSMRGLKNANHVGTALKVLANENAGTSPFGGTSTLTKSEISAILERHPRLPLYVPNSGQMPRGISLGQIGYLRYVASTFCGKAIDADAMVDVLKTGVPSYEGDAIHRWRERMIQKRDASMDGNLSRYVIFNTLKWCWNKFVKQEPVFKIRWIDTHVVIDGLNLKDL